MLITNFDQLSQLLHKYTSSGTSRFNYDSISLSYGNQTRFSRVFLQILTESDCLACKLSASQGTTSFFWDSLAVTPTCLSDPCIGILDRMQSRETMCSLDIKEKNPTCICASFYGFQSSPSMMHTIKFSTLLTCRKLRKPEALYMSQSTLTHACSVEESSSIFNAISAASVLMEGVVTRMNP